MKRIISVVFSVITAAVLSCTACAQCADKVIDNASLLSDSEEKQLESRINDMVEEYGVDFLIYTTNSLDGKDIADYARDTYNSQNCGVGSDKDGAILVISMENRKARISRYGWAVTALTEYCNEFNMDRITPYFSDGEYYYGCETFLEYCDIFIEAAEKGKPYDNNNPYRTAEDWAIMIGISVLIGVIVALVVCLIMKSMMKTAVPKPDANDYVRNNSFKLTRQRDIYVYSRTKRTKRSDSDSSSGGKSSDSEGTTGSF